MSSDSENDDKTQALLVLAAGAEISHYTIINKIGVGGMGEVFLAKDSDLDRQVALKFLPPNLALDEQFRERFMREARSAAAFNHPNIVTIYEVAQSNNRVFIAMEYIEGLSIRELIDKNEVSLDRIINIFIQICDGLMAAYHAGLVHRDIKPANIMVDNNNRVRILDFGLAKSDTDAQLTSAGMTIGTIDYMSPEQAQGLQPDHRSDIFSTGIVLYEMLSGKLPFKSDNIPATLHAIVHDQPSPLSKHNSDFPAILQNIIDKALAKEAKERYQNIFELKNDLLSLEESRQTSVTKSSDFPESRPRANSLAVLYLRNLGDPDDEHLSYGITEDLIIDLTRIGAIRVSSMRSIMKFQNSDAELYEIAEQLKVNMILDGSIHKIKSSIRISAQLIDAHSGENIWADRWEEVPDQLPEIKKNLAKAVGDALKLSYATIEKAEIGKTVIRDAQAYENYLKAKYYFCRKKDVSDINIAIGLYTLALKEEPGLLAAKAGIAEIMMYNGDLTSAKIELESAQNEAIKSKRKSDQAMISKLLAELYVKQSNWVEAKNLAEEALRINREMGDLAGEAESLGILISILQPQAKFDEAIVLFDKVLEISRQLDDQEKIGHALKNMGIAYARKGNYERAHSLYEDCIEQAKKQNDLSLMASCLANIGNIYYFQGKLDMAFKQYQEASEIAEKIGNRALSARQNLNMGLIQLHKGKFNKGIELLTTAADSFQQLDDRGNFALTMVNLSQARLSSGDTEEAINSATNALSIARELNNPLVETDALVQLGSAYFFLRNIEKAVEYYHEGLEIAEKSKIGRNMAHIHISLVYVYYYCKNYQKCRKHATEALSISKEIGEQTTLMLSNALLGAIEARNGLFNTGLRQLQETYKGIEKTGNKQLFVQLKTLLGEVLLTNGKTDKDKQDGQKYLTEALALSHENNLAPEEKLIKEILQGNILEK